MPHAVRSSRGRSSWGSRRAVAASALLLCAVLLAGCSSQASPTRTPASTAAAPASPVGDGVLTIGTLFPSTGGTAFIGGPQLDGVKAAIADINAAGGVNGKPVVLLTADSGDAATQTAEASLSDLAKRGTDVVIGPSSSVLSQRLLTAAAAARIPLISPAATYPQLSDLDTQGVFFRTIPSTALQGVALGTLLPSRKQLKIALLATSDDIGQSIVTTLHDTLTANGGTLVKSVALTASSDPATVIADVKTAAPDAVVLDTPDNGAQTKAFISALVVAGYGGAKLWLTSQNLADYSQALPAGQLAGVSGIIEGASADASFQAKIKAVDPVASSFQYAPEAYDATILAALAATLAHDDAGMKLASKLRAASVGGIKCTSYAECLDVLKSEPAIDYDGVSGDVNLDAAGDPTSGGYGVYTYTADNRYARSGSVAG